MMKRSGRLTSEKKEETTINGNYSKIFSVNSGTISHQRLILSLREHGPTQKHPEVYMHP